jgi:acetolactate synthase-1/2/3 large subunit
MRIRRCARSRTAQPRIGTHRERGATRCGDAIRYRPPAWENARSTIAKKLHPVQALRPLQSLLDSHPDAAFIGDGGEFGQWAHACLPAPHRVINGVAGAIGTALPYAIGVRSALPDAPVVAVLGDGNVRLSSRRDRNCRCVTSCLSSR